MGLFDGVLGAVLNSRGGGGQQDLMGNLVGGLIQQAGGVGGLLDMLRRAGSGNRLIPGKAPGQNLPVDGGDLMKVLGGMMGGAQAQQGGAGGGDLGGLLGQVLAAQHPGIPLAAALATCSPRPVSVGTNLAGLLAQVLPGVLDGMTPSGQVPEQHQRHDAERARQCAERRTGRQQGRSVRLIVTRGR